MLSNNTSFWPLTHNDMRLDFRDLSPLQGLIKRNLFALLTIAFATAGAAYAMLSWQIESSPFYRFCWSLGIAGFASSLTISFDSFRQLRAARRNQPAQGSDDINIEEWLDSDTESPVSWKTAIRKCQEADQRLEGRHLPEVCWQIRSQWSDLAVQQLNSQLLIALIPALAGFIVGTGEISLVKVGSWFTFQHFYLPLTIGTVLSVVAGLSAVLLCGRWESAFGEWEKLADACLTAWLNKQKDPAPPTPPPAPAPPIPPVTVSYPVLVTPAGGGQLDPLQPPAAPAEAPTRVPPAEPPKPATPWGTFPVPKIEPFDPSTVKKSQEQGQSDA
jgi:hypothetical protein